MHSETATAFRNPSVIRKLGAAALVKELGAVGAAYFMRQFYTGSGDYTVEREALLSDVTMEDLLEGVREIERQKP